MNLKSLLRPKWVIVAAMLAVLLIDLFADGSLSSIYGWIALGFLLALWYAFDRLLTKVLGKDWGSDLAKWINRKSN